ARGSGALWWGRFFEKCLEYPADVFFKIDPDTEFRRPFRMRPDFDIFGSYDGTLVQGGIQGFQRRAVESIVHSNICYEIRFKDETTWANNCMEYLDSTGEVSTDFLLLAIAKQLNLTMGNWTEVHSQWKPTKPFRPDVAVVHPRK